MEIAEVVCADERLVALDVADLLDSLVERSLVVPVRAHSSSGIRLVETVRHYGSMHLEDRGDLDRFRRRHALGLADPLEQAMVEHRGERFWTGTGSSSTTGPTPSRRCRGRPPSGIPSWSGGS